MACSRFAPIEPMSTQCMPRPRTKRGAMRSSTALSWEMMGTNECELYDQLLTASPDDPLALAGYVTALIRQAALVPGSHSKSRAMAERALRDRAAPHDRVVLRDVASLPPRPRPQPRRRARTRAPLDAPEHALALLGHADARRALPWNRRWVRNGGRDPRDAVRVHSAARDARPARKARGDRRRHHRERGSSPPRRGPATPRRRAKRRRRAIRTRRAPSPFMAIRS